MISVKTLVRPSLIHGMGLFAVEFIPRDTVVWQFTEGFDLVFTVEQFNALSLVERQFLSTYGWFSKYTKRYLLCVDNGRFTNHSDTPNLRTEKACGLAEGHAVAARDILPGEEITSDYNS